MAATLPASAMAEDARMVVIHKTIGTPGIQLTADGVVQGGKDYGIDATLTGPAAPDAALQVKVIEDTIAQGVDVIGLIPLDVNAAAPALKRAQEAGIAVITFEGADQINRDWNMDMVSPKAFGERQMQIIAEAMGEEGAYQIIVGTLTTPLHNEWADHAVAYQEANYPDMYQAADRLPGGDEVDVSFQNTLDVMKAHPEIKGFIIEGSNGPVGVGNALRQLGLGGKVAITGTLVPSQSAALIEDGIITKGTWWDPIESGYVMVAIAKQIIDGKPFVDGEDIGGVGAAAVDFDEKTIIFDKLLEIDNSNLEDLMAKGL